MEGLQTEYEAIMEEALAKAAKLPYDQVRLHQGLAEMRDVLDERIAIVGENLKPIPPKKRPKGKK